MIIRFEITVFYINNFPVIKKIEWVPTLPTRGGEINKIHRSWNFLIYRTGPVDRITHTDHANLFLSELLLFYLLYWKGKDLGITFLTFSCFFQYSICLRVLIFIQFYFVCVPKTLFLLSEQKLQQGCFDKMYFSSTNIF